MSARERILELKDRMQSSIIGQEHDVERLLIGLLANGNLLVEGLPGLAAVVSSTGPGRVPDGWIAAARRAREQVRSAAIDSAISNRLHPLNPR